MSKKSKKVAITVGIILLLGGVYYFLTNKKRKCIKAEGKWDKPTKTCSVEAIKSIIQDAYDDLHFETNKSVIAPLSYDSLIKLSEYLVDNPTVNLLLAGHTDNQGSDAYNQKLSEDRALAVKVYLVGKGIDETRISTIGYGESKPISDNTSASGRKKNRRVEFILK